MTEVYRRKLALDKYTSTLTAVALIYSQIMKKKNYQPVTKVSLGSSKNL